MDDPPTAETGITVENILGLSGFIDCMFPDSFSNDPKVHRHLGFYKTINNPKESDPNYGTVIREMARGNK